MEDGWWQQESVDIALVTLVIAVHYFYMRDVWAPLKVRPFIGMDG